MVTRADNVTHKYFHRDDKVGSWWDPLSELDMPVTEHKVNVWILIELGESSWDRDKDDVLASSK